MEGSTQKKATAMNKGWCNKDSRIAMALQEERAGGIELSIPAAELDEEEAKRKK